MVALTNLICRGRLAAMVAPDLRAAVEECEPAEVPIWTWLTRLTDVEPGVNEVRNFGIRVRLHDGEPLARALEKLEVGVRRVPMDVQPAQAQKYIVNPLTGRQIQFANLFTTHPPTAERIARLRHAEWRG